MAESAASAPPPRGLPLSVQTPTRHSAVVSGPRPSAGAGGDSVSGDDWDEAAAPALEPPPAGDEDGPPLEDLEAQMHGDLVAQGAGEASRASRGAPRAKAADDDDDEAASSAPLPELDSLVERIPADVRETLDELFRARFVSVKKLPRRVFASGARRK